MRLKNSKKVFWILVLLPLWLNQGCYSFKGISIPAGVESFYVEDFVQIDRNAPSDIYQEFTEALRDKMRTESRLNYTEIDPHINFSGEITQYRISGVAPTEGNTTSLNRMEVKVKVNYTNNQDEDSSWNQNFSFFEDFDANTDLGSIEEELLGNIFAQLTEKIFNKAFADW